MLVTDLPLLTTLCRGGAIAGWASQYIGRRLTIMCILFLPLSPVYPNDCFLRIFVLLIGAFIPLWILPSTFGALSAGAFCIQFGVQGAWGVVSRCIEIGRRLCSRFSPHQIPIQLAEISPPAFRATFPGVAYQLGNVSLLRPLLRQRYLLIFG